MNKNKINEKKIMILIMTIVIVLIFLIFGLNVLFGGAKRVANNYAKGMKNYDSKLIVDLYIGEMIEESYDSKEEMIEYFDSMFKEMEDNYYKILKYSVDDNYKIYKGDELDYQLDKLEEYYNIKPNNVKEIRKYIINFDCNYGGEEKEIEHNLLIANIKGKWYLVGTE